MLLQSLRCIHRIHFSCVRFRDASTCKPDGEHGAGGGPDDSLGDAPQSEAREPCAPKSADHHELGLDLVRASNHRRRRRALKDADLTSPAASLECVAKPVPETSANLLVNVPAGRILHSGPKGLFKADRKAPELDHVHGEQTRAAPPCLADSGGDGR